MIDGPQRYMIELESGTRFFYVDRVFDSAYKQACATFDRLKAKGKHCTMYCRNWSSTTAPKWKVMFRTQQD